MLKMTGVKLKKVADIDMYLLTCEEEEFHTLLKDIVKQIKSTRKIMTLKNRQNIYRTLI